ncbi:hypothetical protein [Amycolatopsis viridis]|uniref:Uncharacterized protein n=1 Tax=Amycolatopsis viridis TaxID=185678 RepID=A0ABX0SXL0_9PSEU|nr:hypothetical protein [Amycolatopsis viridis]NIH81129.1 hypothetical protein [Amycolatopsis viridis]
MGNVVYAEPTGVMALVRLRPGATGERDRVCHLVPIPETGPIPEVLVARCGAPIRCGSAELLERICGMPCEACLARAARDRRLAC